MKTGQWKDFFREIKNSRNRFLSIVFIVALGVAFFTGVNSTQPDMYETADNLYDSTNFFDMRIFSTMGMTENDVEEILGIEGVKAAEGRYLLEVFSEGKEQTFTYNVSSILEDISQVTLTEGRMPKNSTECLVDSTIKKFAGYEIGDQIILETEEGTDIEENLKSDTYTICGFAKDSYYLSWKRATVSIGDGEADGYLLLPESAFSTDYYSSVEIVSELGQDYISMTSSYEDYIEKIKKKVQGIEEEQSSLRYDEIEEKAENEITSNEKKLEEEKTDAYEKLEDAKIKLDEGKIQLDDAKEKISSEEAKIADGKEKLASAVLELESSKEELGAGWQKYNDGMQEYNSNKSKLDSAKIELDKQTKSYESGYSEYEKGLEDYDQGMASLESARKQLAELYGAITQLENSGNTSSETVTLIANYKVQAAAAENSISENQKKLDSAKSTLDATKKQLDAGKIALDNGWAEYNSGMTALNQGKAVLDQSYLTLATAQEKLDQGEKQIAKTQEDLKKGEKEIAKAKAEIAESEADWQSGYEEYTEQKEEADSEFQKAEKKLEDAKSDLENLKLPNWIILDRNSVVSYVEYQMDAERIGAVGKVFPTIFFLVAALVSLTTMTRMVEEERTLIGTLSALGYGKLGITLKYFLYGIFASLIGSGIGVVIGTKFLPYVIMQAYSMMYENINVYILNFQPVYIVISVLGALLCVGTATLFSCYTVLMATPAGLMRPISPPNGKRVFLERIGFIWNNLKFTSKATIRNLVRYKKRFFMTVFGIGSCMGLLLVGFGLRDSIGMIMQKQYSTIAVYDGLIATSGDETDSVLEKISKIKEIDSTLTAMRKEITVKKKSNSKEVNSVNLVVPSDLETFPDFVLLHTRTSGQSLNLDEGGAIITEKLSELLKVEVGDSILIKVDDNNTYNIKISGISENYLEHYIYMAPAYYEKVVGENVSNNRIYFMTNSEVDKSVEAKLSEKILDIENIESVNFVSDMKESVNSMLKSLDSVIWVLIVSAGLLAFVVLYNLNNINISERRRELATIKVLGFYDGEVAEYIFRENILLTFAGVICGAGIGYLLHQYVIRTVEIDMMMFGKNILPLSYLYSVLLTIVFTAIVNFVTYWRLKKIDMVESLKSVE